MRFWFGCPLGKEKLAGVKISRGCWRGSNLVFIFVLDPSVRLVFSNAWASRDFLHFSAPIFEEQAQCDQFSGMVVSLTLDLQYNIGRLEAWTENISVLNYP